MCQAVICGDGICGPGLEDCDNCAADCGACVTTCDNGACELGETCASCPADCSFIRGVACSGACDPTAAVTGCLGNHACVPTARGQLFAPALLGNGVCGAGCGSDADCAGGACLRLNGLDVGGLCGRACAPDVLGCADGATCVPDPADPDRGVCISGGVCNPFSADAGCDSGSGCVPIDGAAELGACLPDCHSQASACAAGTCHARSAPVWHEGSCVGQALACDAARQTGCGGAETCLLIAGPALGGSAQLCSAEVGSAAVGAACTSGCAPGLLCAEGMCQRPCVPGGSGCARCVDASGAYGLAAGAIGFCD